jgi:hypothetical protein
MARVVEYIKGERIERPATPADRLRYQDPFVLADEAGDTARLGGVFLVIALALLAFAVFNREVGGFLAIVGFVVLWVAVRHLISGHVLLSVAKARIASGNGAAREVDGMEARSVVYRSE